MSNWEPPTPPEPTLPPVEPAVSPVPSGAGKSRKSLFIKIGLGVLGGFVALIILGAIIGDPDENSIATVDSTTTTTEAVAESFLARETTTQPTTSTQATSTSLPSTTIAATSSLPPTTITATLPPTTTLPPATTMLPPSVPATWAVASITDGDTLDVNGPDGRWTVRIIGINTPERGECFADEAAAALTALAAGDLVLISDRSDTDQYDRKLRYIETVDGVDIGGEMVRGGYAIARRYEPDTARAATYERLQAEAEAAGFGLWAPDACGPATSGVSIDLDIRYDADGNDNNNLNDEWVRFTNAGNSPLDLNGWQVADESASHRYNFRNLILQPGAAVTLYTGCGTDTDAERYWCNTGTAVWNNSGDTVFLRDPSGNNVITETYAGK